MSHNRRISPAHPRPGRSCALALIFCGMFCGAWFAPALAAQAAPVPASHTAPPVPAAVPPASPAGQVAGAADTVGGYAGQVLEKTLPRWLPPAGTQGLARILVRVGSDGRVLSCEAVNRAAQAAPGGGFSVQPLSEGQSSGDALTNAACRAVGEAAGEAGFGVPPYAMVTEVFLSLAAGPLAGGPGADYATRLMNQVRPHIALPIRLGGPFTADVRVQVRPDGTVQSLRMERSSGRADVDAAILRAFTAPGAVPAPGTARELVLTFTVQGE